MFENLLDEDNPLIRFLTMVANLVILNVLFLVSCLPVITVGAALTGLHAAMFDIIRKRGEGVTATYVKTMKGNFRQATALWAVMLAGAVIMVLAWIYTPAMGSLWVLTVPLGFFLLLAWLMVLIYAFPLMALYENTTGDVVKKSLLLGILNMPRTMLMCVLIMVVPYLCLQYSAALPLSVLLSVFILPAFLGWLCDLTVNRIFRKIDPEPEEEDEWEEEEE